MSTSKNMRKLSTKKCEREGCSNKTPMGSGGYPNAYCGMACFRKSKTFGHMAGGFKKKK